MMKPPLLIAIVSLLVPNLLPAQDVSPGATEVLIGSSLPLDGAFSAVGQATKGGMEAAFNAVNAKGGVSGRKFRLVTYSDGYDPILCVKNTLQLINTDKVFALCSYVGTPTSVKAQPVWQNAKVPVVGFYTGAKALRDPFNRYNIHIRASYGAEVKAAVDAFTANLGASKFAILYQDDAFGDAVKTATEGALTAKGLAPVASGSFVRGTLNVEDAVGKIVPAAPNVVVLVGTYAPLAKAITLAKQQGLAKTVFYTVSFVGPEALAKELGAATDHVVVTEVIPPYTDATQPLVAAYLADLQGGAPSFPSFEAYLNARVLIEGVKGAGAAPTRESLIDAIEAIKPGQIAGAPLSYGAANHQGLSSVYLIAPQGGQWKEIKDWTALK